MSPPKSRGALDFRMVMSSSNRRDRQLRSSGSKGDKPEEHRAYDSFVNNQKGVLDFLADEDEDETDSYGTEIRRTE